MKYDAFISYRHAPLDVAVSEQIHRRLERLKIPRSVQKSSGKKRISRVFRDQEELTVSSSLSDEILSALDESEYLIVICSLRTQESEWVRNEVEYFIAKHGREKVLPVLIEGEPMQSFPRPLLFEEKRVIDVNGQEFVYEQMAEPFAADFRATTEKERERIIRAEILRLAAPLLGCHYDDLKQRHRERRNQSVAFALLALFTATVGFGTYNYWQNQRISENLWRQQRTQSMFLADTSLRLLVAGDRTNAILVALEALPESQDNPDRPLVMKAQYALTESLQAYENGTNIMPDYTVEMDEMCSENVRCAPSDKFFVVLDQQGTLYIKDLATGAPLVTHRATDNGSQGDHYIDFRILSDDRVIGFGVDSTICIDGTTGKILWENVWSDIRKDTHDYDYDFSKVAVSGDEESAIVYFEELMKFIIISLDTGEEVRRIAFDKEVFYITTIALNDDGSQIAIGCSDTQSELIVLDSKSGAEIYRSEEEYSQFVYLKFHSDGRLIAGTYDLDDAMMTPGVYDEYISVHDVASKQMIWNIEFTAQGALYDPGIVLFESLTSESYGESILLVVDKKVYLLDPESGEILTEKTSSSTIVGIVYNQENGIAIYADAVGEINWINLYDGTEYWGLDFSIKTSLNSLTGGGDHVVIIPTESRNVLVFSFIEDAAYEEVETLGDAGADFYTSYTESSADGKFMWINFVIDEDGDGETTDQSYVIDTSTGKCIETVSFEQPVMDCLFLEDRALFILEDGSFLRLDLSSGKTKEINALDDSEYADVIASGDGRRIAVITEEKISVFDAETMESITKYKLEEETDLAQLSFDGAFLVVTEGETLRSIRLADGEESTYEVPLAADAAEIRIVFSTDSSLAAIVGEDRRIHFLDLATGEEISSINALVSFAFSGYFLPGNATFVFQSDDMRIRAVDLASFQLVYTGDDFMYFVQDWIFCEERNTLAVINSSETILFAINGTIEPIAKVPKFCGFSDDGSSFYVLTDNVLGELPYRDLDALLQMAQEVLNGAQLSAENRIKYYVDE